MKSSVCGISHFLKLKMGLCLCEHCDFKEVFKKKGAWKCWL